MKEVQVVLTEEEYKELKKLLQQQPESTMYHKFVVEDDHIPLDSEE